MDVVSIGTLSFNPFWGEKKEVRPSHATTSIIRDDEVTVLVDPSLPDEILAARLRETTGLEPTQIDIVFLTCFRPVHRRGLGAFPGARWLIAPRERSVLLERMEATLEHQSGAASQAKEIESELSLLNRTAPAPDQFGPRIHLFPSYGASPGSCSLLVAGLKTTIIAGDAILNRDYFEHGRVWERAANVEEAKEAFSDILEVADVIVPGHGNIIVRT